MIQTGPIYPTTPPSGNYRTVNDLMVLNSGYIQFANINLTNVSHVYVGYNTYQMGTIYFYSGSSSTQLFDSFTGTRTSDWHAASTTVNKKSNITGTHTVRISGTGGYNELYDVRVFYYG